MTGFDVVIEELRRAGKAAVSAGEQAHSVDLGSTVAGVPGALPGSVSATSVQKAAHTWSTRIKNWSTRVDTHGRSLATAADNYAANDTAAKQDLSEAPRGRR